MSSRRKRERMQDQVVKRRGSSADLFASADLFDSIVSSVSPITPKVAHYSKPVFQTTKYSKYIANNTNRTRASPSLSAILELQELSRILNQTIFSLLQAKSDALEVLDQISLFIRQNSSYDPNFLRMKLSKDIAIKNEIISYTTTESNRLRKIVYEVESFLTFIQNGDKKYFYTTQEFLANEVQIAPSNDRIQRLALSQKQIQFPVIDKSFPQVDAFHKHGTPQYEILNRMRDKFNSLEADDSLFIIENLAKGICPIEEAETVFFEEAWKMQPYPWSLSLFCMTDVSKIVPKVFNPVYLPDKYALLTFEELAMLSSWPLKHLVSILETIIFDIDPFSICRCFWKVIDGINETVMKLAPFPKSEEPLDFDQLFSYLIIVVFATLSPSITYGLNYAAGYANAIENDAQMKFAMGHLQGLTTYIQQVNYYDLESKSEELIKQKMNEDTSDPLGIL